MALKSASRPVASNPIGPLQGDPPPEIPRDQWGRPLIAPSSAQGGWCRPVGMTRASTLGGVLESQWGLNRWRSRQIARGLSMRPDLVLALQTCTAAPEDKSRIDEICDKAFEHAEGTAAATIGTSIHHLADFVDKELTVPDVGPYNATVNAYRETVSHFTFHLIEQFTVCEELSTAGTPDRLCSPNGYLVAPDMTVITPDDRLVWDLKTSSTSDYFGIKFTCQFTPYALGQPYRHLESRSVGRGKAIEVRGEYLDWPDGIRPSRKWGLICHAPAGEDFADLHWVPIESAGVELSEMSVRALEWRKAQLIVPASLPTAELPDGLAGRSWIRSRSVLLSKIKNVESEQELDLIWDQYGESSVWTDDHTAEAQRVLAQLSRPEHVRKLELTRKIRMAESEDEIVDLWGDNSDIWDDSHTRMRTVVLRNLLSK
jgi:hypothetical protein